MDTINSKKPVELNRTERKRKAYEEAHATQLAKKERERVAKVERVKAKRRAQVLRQAAYEARRAARNAKRAKCSRTRGSEP